MLLKRYDRDDLLDEKNHRFIQVNIRASAQDRMAIYFYDFLTSSRFREPNLD